MSSDGRFRALRDALHRCDPPCIPYLGLYLTDLSFIEEGTPTFTPDGLLNFSKMRMVGREKLEREVAATDLLLTTDCTCDSRNTTFSADAV